MSFDLILFNAIHGLAGWSAVLDTAGIFLAQYLPYILVIPLIFFLLRGKTVKTRIHTFLFLTLLLLLSRGVFTETIRFFFPRQRPFEALGFTSLIPESGVSFPSGHAAFFFAVSFAMYAVEKAWGWWFLGLSLLNGIARVFVGVHYPFDIVGGALVALASYLILTRILCIVPPQKTEQNAPLTEEERKDEPEAI